MRVSHEVPISLLEKSLEFNDYDYCLVHLLRNDTYQQFYRRAVANGRRVILDNSIFELGKAFDPFAFYQQVELLNPSEHIVPDVLEDCEGTIDSFLYCKSKYEYPFERANNRSTGVTIGVVQGKTFDELLRCYKFMALHADKIAISFDYSAYLNLGYTWDSTITEKLQLYCTGRQNFISMLHKLGVWVDKPHHLLGASLPQEFLYYNKNNIDNIETIDTSNPIVAGMKGISYDPLIGMIIKPAEKLADLINQAVTPEQYSIIEKNTYLFKKINGII